VRLSGLRHRWGFDCNPNQTSIFIGKSGSRLAPFRTGQGDSGAIPFHSDRLAWSPPQPGSPAAIQLRTCVSRARPLVRGVISVSSRAGLSSCWRGRPRYPSLLSAYVWSRSRGLQSVPCVRSTNEPLPNRFSPPRPIRSERACRCWR